MTHTPALLALDLDGTLVNTESVSLPDMIAYLNEDYGIPITLEHWLENYHGIAAQALLDKLHAEYGSKIELKPFMARRQQRLESLFAKGLPPAPGMLQAIRALHAQGTPMCICTNSPPQRVELTLRNVTGQHAGGTDLAEIFKRRIHTSITREGAGKAKPAPDVYLGALAAYQVPPSSALAVEDSEVGVLAAKAAGIPCWAYVGLAKDPAHTAAKLKKAGAEKTFAHWDDFLGMFNKLKG